MNFIVSVTECVFHTWDRRPSSFHIQFVHTGSSIFTRYLYPKQLPVVLHWMWFDIGSNVIVSFLGFMRT